jgi:hypothetical protein
MIQAGYMLKRVVRRPDWIHAAHVKDIYSLSGCVSENFTDYINHWKHNGHWLFNSLAPIEEIARERRLDISGMMLFYYEVFETQFDEDTRTWSKFEPEQAFPTKVETPEVMQLEGFDVTTFSVGTSPECSPLSCNDLAADIAVNKHCLFDSFDQARQALECGKFDGLEPGPFRTVSVHTVGADLWPPHRTSG